MNQLHTIGNLCDDLDCLKCMMADLDATVAANGGAVHVVEIPTPEKTRNKVAGQRSGRGVVRTISARQVAFILRLINTKNTTGITLLPGQTLNVNDVPSMGVKGGSALIEKLLACPDKTIPTAVSVSITNQGTPKQQSFLKSLMQQRNLTESDVREYSTISAAIDALLKMPKKTVTLREGLYAFGDILYRLSYTRGSHQLVAYTWEAYDIPVETKKGLKYGEFNYEGKGPLYKLTEDMRVTREQAQAFGMKMHFCMMCGIQLTNKDSIKRGIGPICNEKF